MSKHSWPGRRGFWHLSQEAPLEKASLVCQGKLLPCSLEEAALSGTLLQTGPALCSWQSLDLPWAFEGKQEIRQPL
jgi:hypothetical protein